MSRHSRRRRWRHRRKNYRAMCCQWSDLVDAMRWVDAEDESPVSGNDTRAFYVKGSPR